MITETNQNPVGSTSPSPAGNKNESSRVSGTLFTLLTSIIVVSISALILLLPHLFPSIAVALASIGIPFLGCAIIFVGAGLALGIASFFLIIHVRNHFFEGISEVSEFSGKIKILNAVPFINEAVRFEPHTKFLSTGNTSDVYGVFDSNGKKFLIKIPRGKLGSLYEIYYLMKIDNAGDCENMYDRYVSDITSRNVFTSLLAEACGVSTLMAKAYCISRVNIPRSKIFENDIDLTDVTMYEFIENATNLVEFMSGTKILEYTPKEMAQLQQQLSIIQIIDYIAGQGDRCPGNLLRKIDGNIVAIDHDLCLPCKENFHIEGYDFPYINESTHNMLCNLDKEKLRNLVTLSKGNSKYQYNDELKHLERRLNEVKTFYEENKTHVIKDAKEWLKGDILISTLIDNFTYLSSLTFNVKVSYINFHSFPKNSLEKVCYILKTNNEKKNIYDNSPNKPLQEIISQDELDALDNNLEFEKFHTDLQNDCKKKIFEKFNKMQNEAGIPPTN